MKIGIDAKWFFTGNPSGRVVVRNLIKQMVLMETEHEFYLFLDRRDNEKLFPYTHPRVHLVYVWADINLLSNMFVIPFVSQGLHLDAIVYQYFTPLWSNSKRIAFIHDMIFVSHPQFFTLIERIYLNSMRILGRFAHRICTVSNNERKRIERYRLRTLDMIDVVYNGVDEIYRPLSLLGASRVEAVRSRYALPEEFILYVGRLNERKNIRNLLRAMPLLRNESIPLVIAGNYDWKMFGLDAEISRLGIAGRVIQTGFVEDEDLPVLFSLAKVFCFVSFEEGFGLPALEAMASGVPVVVSDCSSLPEICGEAGNYVDPYKPVSIAAMIDKLLEDKSLYIQMRDKGLKRSKLFKWEYSAVKLLESVKKAVD